MSEDFLGEGVGGRKENFAILLLHSTFDTHSRFTLWQMPSSPELFPFTFFVVACVFGVRKSSSVNFHS